MRKVTCNHPHGIQLRLLNGTLYLRGGESTSLTDVQLTHNSVKVSLANGSLSVVAEPVAPTTPVETPAPVETKRGKAPKVVVEVDAEPTPAGE